MHVTFVQAIGINPIQTIDWIITMLFGKPSYVHTANKNSGIVAVLSLILSGAGQF
jgi:hypothetical protein